MLLTLLSCPLFQLQMRISHEHSGFTFEPEPSKAAEMVKLHSGGKVSEALLMSMSPSSLVETSDQPKQTDCGSSDDCRRSKYEKDDHCDEKGRSPAGGERNLLVPPPPQQKNMFCCFHLCMGFDHDAEE